MADRPFRREKMNIFRFNYRRTNCYLIRGNENRLIAFDAGWPCSYFEYAKEIKSTGFNIDQIESAIVSHFHIDHAGLFGEMISKGIACIIFENQLTQIDEMERMILKKQKEYKMIDKTKLIRVKTEESRKWFLNLGIEGEVIMTLGHSVDSISFVSDEGIALIGDLHAEDQIMSDDLESIHSWELIRNKGAKLAYPAHGNEYML